MQTLIKKDHFFATCDLLGVCLQLNEHLLLFRDDGIEVTAFDDATIRGASPYSLII